MIYRTSDQRASAVGFVRSLLGPRIVRVVRAAKLWARQRLRLAFYHRVQVARPVELHGSPDYGGWSICPEGIDARSVVYDFGVGEDNSFAISLIERYGLHVWAFDPTPRSIEWIRRQPPLARLSFLPYGIAAFDGHAKFYLPANPQDVSGSLIPNSRHSGEPMEVEVRRLTSIMAQLGHPKVDVLKLDIEGAEYEVLEDVLRARANVEQILVEFHVPDSEGQEFALARTTIALLNQCGYSVFAVRHGTDFSFIRTHAGAKEVE